MPRRRAARRRGARAGGRAGAGGLATLGRRGLRRPRRRLLARGLRGGGGGGCRAGGGLGAQLLALGDRHDLVPTELAAQRGDGLHRRRALLARGEPGEQRRRDDRHRHRERDRLLDGPATLAGVGGVVGDVLEDGVLLEGLDHEVEQPGPHDRAAAPRLERPGHVLDDVLLLEQLVALGVRGHQAVLDAVVHHLRVVPGADLAGVHEALVARALGAQRVEDRHRLLHVGRGAADHQAVAVVQPPDAAGDAAVEVADALGLEQLLVLGVVGELAVAAVDDQVALVEQARRASRPCRGSAHRAAP